MKRQLQWNLLLLLPGAMLLGGCKEAGGARLAPLVRSAVVEVSRASSPERLSASVVPAAQVDLGFRVAGYVQSIRRTKSADGQWRELDAGDPVQASEVLVSIRQTDYQSRSALQRSQLAEARSAMANAKAQLDEAIAVRNQARITCARSQVLFDSQAMIKPDYDEARSAFDRAEARVAGATAQVAVQQARIDQSAAAQSEADSALADTELRAPFSGVVVSRKVEIGSLAAPGGIAFTLADLRNVKVAFGVPDVTLHAFQVGQVLSLTTESVPGCLFTGHISTISPSADPATRVYTVEVAVPNPKGVLKAGMIAAIQWTNEVSARPSPVVPLSAVVHTAGMEGYGVFVLESKNGKTTARLRKITLGSLSGTRVMVSEGLTPGEHVAEDGGLQLMDGDIVTEIR